MAANTFPAIAVHSLPAVSSLTGPAAHAPGVLVYLLWAERDRLSCAGTYIYVSLEARNAFLQDLPFSSAQLLGLSTLLSTCITQAELTHLQFHVLNLHGALFVKGNAFPKESNVLRLCLLLKAYYLSHFQYYQWM